MASGEPFEFLEDREMLSTQCPDSSVILGHPYSPSGKGNDYRGFRRNDCNRCIDTKSACKTKLVKRKNYTPLRFIPDLVIHLTLVSHRSSTVLELQPCYYDSHLEQTSLASTIVENRKANFNNSGGPSPRTRSFKLREKAFSVD